MTAQAFIENLKKSIPQFHTQAMWRPVYEIFGLVIPSTRKLDLRHLYKSLVGDTSASTNLSEAEINTRVANLFKLEEPGLVYDLHHHYIQWLTVKFEVFWEKVKEFLEEDVGTALDDRRHSMVIHVVKLFLWEIFEKKWLNIVPKIHLSPVTGGYTFCSHLYACHPTQLYDILAAWKWGTEYSSSSGGSTMKTHSMQRAYVATKENVLF